jgi:hypothetical protein
MTRNLYPFKKQQGSSTVYGPLSPYGSKKAEHSLNEESVDKNYTYVAFASGDTLQSSDLNEQQETHYIERNLAIESLRSWGFFQGPPANGDNGRNRVGSPGWNGATPIIPGIPISTNVVPTISRKQGEYSPVTITKTSDNLSIKFNEGFYRLSTLNGTAKDHGFLYHVYLNQNDGVDKFKVTVSKEFTSGITYVGLKFNSKEILPQTRTVTGTDTDSTLMNDKLKSVDDQVTVAKRIQYEFSEATELYGGVDTIISDFAPVLYVDHLNKKVKYMNNLLIDTF